MKAYAYANGKVPSFKIIEDYPGYAQKWNEDDVLTISQGEAIVIAGSVILAFYSIALTIAIVPTVCNKLYDKTQSRKNNFYLYFWSAVPLIYMLIICVFFYGLTQASATLIFSLNLLYIAIVTVFTGFLAMLFSIIYCLWSAEERHKKRHKSVPCPLLCFCTCCLDDCCHCMNNCCAIFMTSGILVYLMYAFPAIIIAYYVFPSRTLVLLSFIQVALLVLVLTITLFLYLLERMCLLCLLRCSGIPVEDPEATTQELINVAHTAQTEEPSYDTRSTEEGIQLLQPGQVRHNQHDAITVELLIWSLFKAGVALFGLIVLFFLLVILGMVVFTQSAEESDRIDQFLTILPTILVNLIIWTFRTKLFHLGKTLTEMVTERKV